MRRELIILTVALISACGTPSGSDGGAGGGTGGGTGGGGGSDAGTLGDAGTLVGTFQLLHTVSEFGDSSSLFGKVYDGPTPATTVWTVDLRNGDCRVETPRVPFCATPCGGSAACVEDDVCQAYPTSKSAGTVHFTGARVGADGGVTTPFDATPINNGYQAPGTISLGIPPFADNTTLTLAAAGSTALPAFTIATTGVAPIALGQTSYALAQNTALDLTWTTGSTATGAIIEVELDISHHGGIRGQILCETPDDGSLTIGADLTTRLINLGVSGFPTIKVRRVKTGFTVLSAGRVDFKAVSGVELGLTIPGLTSCTDDSECPMGQTCQTDLRCQ